MGSVVLKQHPRGTGVDEKRDTTGAFMINELCINFPMASQVRFNLFHRRCRQVLNSHILYLSTSFKYNNRTAAANPIIVSHYSKRETVQPQVGINIKNSR